MRAWVQFKDRDTGRVEHELGEIIKKVGNKYKIKVFGLSKTVSVYEGYVITEEELNKMFLSGTVIGTAVSEDVREILSRKKLDREAIEEFLNEQK